MRVRRTKLLGLPRQWDAPWVIAWRLPWWIMTFALRCALFLVTFVGWGSRQARRMWDETK